MSPEERRVLIDIESGREPSEMLNDPEFRRAGARGMPLSRIADPELRRQAEFATRKKFLPRLRKL